MITQNQWMEERLDVFRDAILKSNNTWCFTERLKVQERVEAELSGVAIDERYVKALEWMLEDLSTPLTEGEVFAGRMVEGPWPREDSPYRWMSKPFFSTGHTTLDWPTMLSKGLLEMAEDIVGNAGDIGTEEARRFAGSAVRCCRAIDGFARRYAEAARKEAGSGSNPAYRQQLNRIADALENAPGRPARNFFEALQAIWLVHFVTSCVIGSRDFSFGRIDQYLLPYYERDVREGILDREDARLLLAHLYIKTKEITGTGADNYKVKPIPSQASNQYITIGGRSVNGDSMDNELSVLILEALALSRVPQPEINVRIDTESPPAFKEAVGLAMQKCTSQVQLWNDSQLLDSLLSFVPQVSKEEAYDYCFTACNRIDIPGRMNVFQSGGDNFHILPTWLLAALDGGRNPTSGDIMLEGLTPLDQIGAMDDILTNFRRVAETVVTQSVNTHLQRVRDMPPETFHFESVMQHDCIETCRDVSRGGIRYPLDTHLFVGIATVADSLSAIQHIVYDVKRLTLPAFMTIVRNNFDGEEELRSEILHNCPHYGNNDDHADHWAVAVTDLLFDVTRDVERPPENLIVPALYSLHVHCQLGDDYPATPDGRKKGDFVSENQSPTHGADRSGLTALLHSAAKLPNWRTLESGLNVRFLGKLEPEHFMSMADTFFDMGGQHLGVTVVDRETLLDAVAHPEDHEDLCVRITGFSAYFNTLSPEGKQDIIDRTGY